MSRFLILIFFLPVTLLAQNWTSKKMFDDKKSNLKTAGNYEVKIGVNLYSKTIASYSDGGEYKHLILPRFGFGYMHQMNNLIFNPNITINVMGFNHKQTSNSLHVVSQNDPLFINTFEYTSKSIYFDLDFLFHYQIFNNNSIVAGAFINSPIARKVSWKEKLNDSIIYESKGVYSFNHYFGSPICYGLDIAYRINVFNYSASIGLEREIGMVSSDLYIPSYNIYLSIGYKI